MSEENTFKEAREHAKAARAETRAAVRSLLPDTFWQHADESKREAKLAAEAFRRAFRQQFCRPMRAGAPKKTKIDIA
jgi:predicted TIM-barrel fold metal-dependent hydrolase